METKTMTDVVLHESPIGTLTLVSREGALMGVFMDDHKRGPRFMVRGHDKVLDETRRQLDLYFERKLTAFELPIREDGTPFQRRVWEALRGIPFGQTTSYGWLAGVIGSPLAMRAVGSANGRNPISIITPCHRVIGADGSLTGYAGGLDRKRFLLELEGALEPELL